MANRISTVLDIDDKGFKGSLKSIGTSVGEADGFFGKFKAGAGAAMDTVKANAGAFAVAAGASLVAFGVKAVGAFTETAKAALDLSTATGLSTEQASRWIAVGDDFEVSAEALATGLGKVAKTMDDAKWGQYGIATRDAGGAARDTNDILLDSLDMLSSVTNETERARIGQQLFGKGYQSLTPILGHTRAEYEKMLGTVEKGQVITAEEAKKAEKFRLAQDQLGDALKDVTIAIGEQVAGLTPLLVGLAKLIGLMDDVGSGLTGGDDSLKTLYALRAEADKGGKSWEDYFLEVDDGKITLDEAVEAIKETAAKVDELSGAVRDGEKSWETQTEWLEKSAMAASETDRETRRLTEGMKGGTEAFEGVKVPIDNASTAMDKFREKTAGADLAYRRLTGELDEEDAWAAVNESIASYATKMKDAGKDTDLAAQHTRDLNRDIADYVATTDTIPVQKKTEILAAIRDGDIAKMEMLLAEVARTREIYLTLTGPGAVTAAGYEGGISGRRAAGGPVTAGKAYMVGEKGPEPFVPSQNGTIIPNDALGSGGGTYNYTINMPVGTSPDEMMRTLEKWRERNGNAKWMAGAGGISGGTP